MCSLHCSPGGGGAGGGGAMGIGHPLFTSACSGVVHGSSVSSTAVPPSAVHMPGMGASVTGLKLLLARSTHTRSPCTAGATCAPVKGIKVPSKLPSKQHVYTDLSTQRDCVHASSSCKEPALLHWAAFCLGSYKAAFHCTSRARFLVASTINAYAAGRPALHKRTRYGRMHAAYAARVLP